MSNIHSFFRLRNTFVYLVYTAPHCSLHALPENIEKYKDTTYKVSWEAIRNARYERQKQPDIFPGMDNFLSDRQFKDKWAYEAWAKRCMVEPYPENRNRNKKEFN